MRKANLRDSLLTRHFETISGCPFFFIPILSEPVVPLRAREALPPGRGVREHRRRRLRQPQSPATEGGGAQEVRVQEALPQLQEPGVPARSDIAQYSS